MYNRIWGKGVASSNCASFRGFTYVLAINENNPLPIILKDYVESNGSDPIVLTFDLPESTPQSAYFVFYITEIVEKNSNESRTMKIEIDGQDQGKVEAPNNGETSVITKYPVTVSGPNINIISGPKLMSFRVTT
ncbi:hypothetical protein POM88_048679 [Heracleum sosnowskyi]|uniref:Malectin-like domain-containing protein n=1 Tax=Heracleum sosnowskyi TaxID=360622 RepID=A0AAD8GWQ7_9APIA|nr:hypothetical protein POM88_048679 [Heracleum sosnowskyi]